MSYSADYITRDVVVRKDVTHVGNCFVKWAGSREQAVHFLESVIANIDPTRSRKRHAEDLYGYGAYETATTVAKAPRIDVLSDNDLMAGQYADAPPGEFTMGVLIPNDMSLCSHVIGRQGTGVAEIRRKSGCRSQLERAQLMPPTVTDRHVFMMGTIQALVHGYQLLLLRMSERRESSAAYSDTLKLVIPTELIAHLIGKGGVVIKRIQAESGAKTHLQTEEEMYQSGYFYGRTMSITGDLRQRCQALLLVMKHIASDRLYPAQWKGGMPQAMMTAAPPSQYPPSSYSTPYPYPPYSSTPNGYPPSIAIPLRLSPLLVLRQVLLIRNK